MLVETLENQEKRKMYVVLSIIPWEALSHEVDDDNIVTISLEDGSIGMCPVFTSKEEAEKAYAGYQILELDIVE